MINNGSNCPFPPPSFHWQMHQLRPAFANHHVYAPRQWGCHLCMVLVPSLPGSVLASSMRAAQREMYPETLQPSSPTNNQNPIITVWKLNEESLHVPAIKWCMMRCFSSWSWKRWNNSMKHRGRGKTEDSVYTKLSPFQEMRHWFCCTEVTSKKENHRTQCWNKTEVFVQ